jgi:hypothetical protein
MRIIPSIRSLVFALVMLAVSAAAFAQFGISISIAPPALPVYEQPPVPAEGYLWTPGYWAYGEDDYYWVPGTWVMAPQVGFLWTPGYWGWGNGGYAFNEGYWGPHVGFYGGINYGYGYGGEGYEGGRWDNGRFAYNRSVNNVNVTNIHNTYNTTVINNNTTTVNRVSYNGGNGGVSARPNAQQEAAAHEKHVAPVAEQTQHAQAARANPEQRASVNHGKPAIAATPKPGAFNDHAALPAKEAGAPYKPAETHAAVQPPANSEVKPAENNVPRPPNAVHAQDLQPHARPAPPNTGNPKQDQKYQQQQDKLYAKQEQDHQKLQQKQEQDHQRLTQQKADQARTQQVEQRHQQQTQQLEQKHTQQQQKLQARIPQPPPDHRLAAAKR